MKTLALITLMLLTACISAKEFPMLHSTVKLHSVSMNNQGPEIYDFRIQYGNTLLPFGNEGDPEFGAGGERVYSDVMPLPDVAIVEWRTATGPAGRNVRFEVPLRSAVTNEERTSRFFTVDFRFNFDKLEVFVGKSASDVRKHGRLIYSKKAPE